MYPFRQGLTYAREQWYVAAWSSEVTRTPLARTLLDAPVVLYRTASGSPVAMHGMCLHRRFPLGLGKLNGDNIVCGYHGFTYNEHGSCVGIPSQDRIPANFQLRSYPLIEKWQWIWIWMGDPANADPALIPDHAALRLDSEGWFPAVGDLQQLGARYQLLNENVLDLTHVSFIHEGNIGSPEVATTPVEVSQQNGSVRVARYLPKAPPPPVYAGMMGIPGAADREIVTEYYPPALLVSGSEFFEPVAQPRSSSYGAFRVLHAPTPETSRSTHYFWAFSRTFGADDDALTQRFRVFLQEVLDQDKRAIEAQEQAIPEDANSLDDRSAASDVGALKGRHLLEELMQRELVTR